MDDTETEISLPYEIIETILSRSPAKSLFRFKAVCKQWNATISDPRFLEAHVRQSNDSSSSSYFFRQINSDLFTRVQLQNNQLSTMEDHQPLKLDLDVAMWCHCDGLVLLSISNLERKDHVMWNPSTGSRKDLRSPISAKLVGICYDQLLGDYKVVVRKNAKYAVYRCKTNSWTMRKEMDTSPTYHINVFYHYGVPFEGCIYWINSPGKGWGDEVVCFDGRDEEFKILPAIDRLKGVGNWAGLISSTEGLYVFPYHKPCPLTNELLFMEKAGDSWMERKVQLPFLPYRSSCVIPLSWSGENKIILRVHGLGYLICDVCKRSWVVIENSFEFSFSRLVPYVENMLLL